MLTLNLGLGMTQKLCAMMCSHAVTVPLWEMAQNAGSCQGQASMLLSASACKILTFLLDEDAHRRLTVVV